MNHPLVDVTIAVHSATRPIARAAASVLHHTRAPVRVTVVAHNIDEEVIRRNLGALTDNARLRMLVLKDGIRSPAGPMNLGMEHATARFHSLLGSDDEFAPGAIDSWLALQRTTGAAVVLARISLASGSTDPYPPVRGGRRTRDLDAERDRLHYRSAPLGLVDREVFGDLRLAEGLPSGEDLAYCATLWETAPGIAYDLHGPAYITHDDVGDRVTAAPRPVALDFAFLAGIRASGWFMTAPPEHRVAFVLKVIRLHVFDAIAARVDRPQLPDDVAGLLRTVDDLLRDAPSAERLLSFADRRVLDAMRVGADPTILKLLLARRRAYRTPAALLPRNPLLALHRQAPARTLLAGALTTRGGRA